MQLKQLSYFIAVAEHGSINRAAASLYLAQSSLSQSIQTLEEELGFPLLTRSRSGVQLTGMGELVYRQGKELLTSADRLAQSWKAVYQERCALTGLVRIGTVPGMHPFLTRRILPELKTSFPNIRYKVLEARSTLLPSYLARDQVDLILSDYPDTQRESTLRFAREHGLTCVELCPDFFKIAVGLRRPLAKKEQLSAQEAKALPLACYSGGDAAAEQYFSHGFDRSISTEYTSIEKMVQEAVSGPGVSVLPEGTIRSAYPDALRFLTVDGFCVPFTHFVAFRPGSAAEKEIDVTVQTMRRIFTKEFIPVQNCEEKD